MYFIGGWTLDYGPWIWTIDCARRYNNFLQRPRSDSTTQEQPIPSAQNRLHILTDPAVLAAAYGLLRASGSFHLRPIIIIQLTGRRGPNLVVLARTYVLYVQLTNCC
jgi:hypothetical protein